MHEEPRKLFTQTLYIGVGGFWGVFFSPLIMLWPRKLLVTFIDFLGFWALQNRESQGTLEQRQGTDICC